MSCIMLLNFANYLFFGGGDINILGLLRRPVIAPYFIQMDIDSARGWCTANHVDINCSKYSVTSFTKKINMIYFEYTRCVCI
jgi:hypothetical protein